MSAPTPEWELWPVVSRTHHVVRRSPDGAWFAKAYSANAPFEREQAVLQLLGREFWTPAPRLLIMASLGWGLQRWTTGLGTKVTAAKLRPDLPGSWAPPPVPSGLLPEVAQWVSDLRVKVADRRGEHPRAWWDDLIDATLNRVNVEVLAGDRLLHTDPHVKNWALGSDGELRLLDWESAFRGHEDVFWGCVAFEMRLQQRRHLADELAAASDPAVFGAAVALKAATAVSWGVWDARRRGDDPEPAARMRARAGGLLDGDDPMAGVVGGSGG